MTAWLGIAILLAFSLGLNLFMRLEAKAATTVPSELTEWHRVPQPQLAGDVYLERRFVEVEGRWLLPNRWVEQRRIRRSDDGAIVEVLNERPFRARALSEGHG